MGIEHLEVAADNLTTLCNPEDLGFETTAELEPLDGTIGQERAESALELSLEIDSPGFNVYISGIAGSGRNTALKSQLARIACTKPVPPDWGYVHNFDEPSQPLAISLPCGMMRILAQDMAELVTSCRHDIPAVFESDDYTHRIEEVTKEFQMKRQAITDDLEQLAQKVGFTLTFTQVGITPVPVKDGQQMTQEEFTGLADDEREGLRERAESIQHDITHATQEMRRFGKEAGGRVKDVDAELVRFTLTPIINELKEKFKDHPRVVDYIDHVEADMVENLDVFKPQEPQQTPQIPGLTNGQRDADLFDKYRVNDLIDNATCDGAPVVFEYSPTYYNLFGRIEYRARVGTFATDLTMIKPGAMHRANGGYLVIQARDLLMSPLSWETLKRTLRSGEVQIENIGEQFSPLPSATLRPETIPVNAKIILVGSPMLVQMLRGSDEDFRRYFKVVADFDSVMTRNKENMTKYAGFVAGQAALNGLQPFHKSAVARIMDYSSRLVEDQDKLTTRFMDIADMLTESNYWAKKSGADIVLDEHVKQALEQKHYRLSLTEDRLQEFIEDGTIQIETRGAKTGQINGLAVYSLGDYSFGKPSKITARVSVGRGQILNIERETQMSGKIHNKGFMTLSGYLHGKYGHDKPLSLSASIGFEQTYSEVDGDSASSTELYTLLSELSARPSDQGIAVTGSVNQAGDVQAIGGATHKIEGFFAVCEAQGLTGTQGVMIPATNLRNLVLKDEVVSAVRDGKFHIYGVNTIDEGIEVLTGTPAGKNQEDGSYPEGTIHYLVEQRLHEMAKKARDYGRTRNEGDEDSDGKGKDDPPGEAEEDEDS